MKFNMGFSSFEFLFLQTFLALILGKISIFRAYLVLKFYATRQLIQSTIVGNSLGPMGQLIAVGIGLVVVVLFAGMAIVGAQNSANLVSATTTISQFLPIIGIGIAVAILAGVLTIGAGGRRGRR